MLNIDTHAFTFVLVHIGHNIVVKPSGFAYVYIPDWTDRYVW